VGSGIISADIAAWDLLHVKATVESAVKFKQVNLKVIQKHIKRSYENFSLDFVQVCFVSEFAQSKKILL